MRAKILPLFVILSCILCVTVRAETPKPNAHITEYHLEGKPASGNDGGTSLSITYDDGTHFVENLPKKSTIEGDIPATFSDVRLAEDKQTLGWEINYDNCCQSYPIPLTLILYRHGKIIQRITQNYMLWDWEFAAGGRKVATLWGPTHDRPNGYQLYDVVSGKVLEEVDNDWDTQKLKADAPEWAKQLQYHMDNRK